MFWLMLDAPTPGDAEVEVLYADVLSFKFDQESNKYSVAATNFYVFINVLIAWIFFQFDKR